MLQERAAGASSLVCTGVNCANVADENAGGILLITIKIERQSSNVDILYTMMANPMKTLELYYLIVQFLIVQENIKICYLPAGRSV